MTITNHTRRQFLKGLLAATAIAASPFGVGMAEASSGSAVAAVKAALEGNFSEAGALAQQSGDSAAIKLVELIYLKDHGDDAGYNRVMNFLAAAPDWPLSDTLNKRAEQALYQSGETALCLAHFGSRTPMTAEGYLALARGRYAAGHADEGKSALRGAWLNAEISAELEKAIAREFSSRLTDSDHRARLWRLIYAQEATGALRFAKQLGGEYTSIAKAAQALLQGSSNAERLYGGLSSKNRGIPALRFALARYYRRLERFGKARGVLVDAPATAAEMGDPAAWWTERRIIARRSIGPTHKETWATGYRIASQHGLTSGNDAIDAEFLSGWIALRYLNAPDTAMKHFVALKAISPTRTDKARAQYWIGRTHLAAGNKSAAKDAFKDASRYTTIYYGQLAREHLGLGTTPEKIDAGDTTNAARNVAERDEVIRAFQLMARAGTKRHLYMFLLAISRRFDSVAEMNAAAAIVHGTAGTSLALKLAKAAGIRGIDIDSYSYPIRGLPQWKQIGKPVEKSLVFALSRQESEFDPEAGSKVGAQGLMQLMPGTAKLIARQYGVAYTPSKLTGDPAYNVKLGAAHLADLVEDFGGSYVLTLVAYNAGPRRAKEWVQEYGDLRSNEVDPIDWVESIPFQETRQYVQKVLQNLHIYRSRLAPKTVRAMSADLRRGSPSELTVASTSAPPERDCAGGSIVGLIRGCD